MDLIISGKNFKLTPSLKAYVEEKMARLNKFWNKIIRVRVELDVERNQKSGDVYGVEAKLEVPGPDIQVGSKSSDMHAAIDEIMPRLERLLVKTKGKLESRLRKNRKSDNSKF